MSAPRIMPAWLLAVPLNPAPQHCSQYPTSNVRGPTCATFSFYLTQTCKCPFKQLTVPATWSLERLRPPAQAGLDPRTLQCWSQCQVCPASHGHYSFTSPEKALSATAPFTDTWYLTQRARPGAPNRGSGSSPPLNQAPKMKQQTPTLPYPTPLSTPSQAGGKNIRINRKGLLGPAQ